MEVVLVVKGRCAGKKNVCHNTDAPVIALHAVWLLQEDFGSDVARRATRGARKLVHVQTASEAKVCNFERGDALVFRMQEQIFRLDVTVNNAKAMTIGNSVHDCLGSLPGLILGELIVLDDLIEELASEQQLHDEANMSFIFEDIDKFNDVWMIHGL